MKRTIFGWLFCSCLFVGAMLSGLVQNARASHESLRDVVDSSTLLMIGIGCFALFFPVWAMASLWRRNPIVRPGNDSSVKPTLR